MRLLSLDVLPRTLSFFASASSPQRAPVVQRIVWATLAALLCAVLSPLAFAQDVLIGVTYVCNGERIAVDSCNIRDTSDTSNCMVGHPDHVQPNGLMQYTTVSRGALKKLLPTCKQPSADEVARAKAFQKRQQDTYDANVAKANQQLTAPPAAMGQPQKPKTPEEREMNRCITSGRLPASCMGNGLLAGFGQMLAQVLPGADKGDATAGPIMAGVFQGAGNWRLDFIDGGVLVNCAGLSPNQEAYTVDLKTGHLVIETKPRPLVLTLRADGTIVGPPGPVTIEGVVATGTGGGGTTAGHTETHQETTHQTINQNQTGAYSGTNTQVTSMGGGAYDAATTTTKSTYVPGTQMATYSTFSPRRATCPAINLTSKGAGTGIQTMETDLLKTAFGGDKGPPTPPGIRMHGIYAAATGFSVQFFPESAVLGCGPDAARAYPYAVVADGTRVAVKIDAPDHPLMLAFRPDGSLDPGAATPYQVHGRTVTGQSNDDNFTFAPMERSCGLAPLAAAKAIPAVGGVAAVAATASSGAMPNPGAASGNALLTIVSGFPAQAGAPNPLAGKPYTLLRESLTAIVTKAGVALPVGSSAYKAVGTACGNRTPDCQRILDALKADAASAVRADATGGGTFPGVAPGTYYLMISTSYNNKALTWGQPVDLKPGANSLTLDLRNATPLN